MNDIQRLKNLTVPSGITDCVLDTDAYNEIDDQYALALMVKSKKCNVKAFYAAPFFNGNSTSPEDGMEKSYNEILNLLTLMGCENEKSNVYKGSRNYLSDEKTPVESPASEHLASLAMNYSCENPLYIIAIGAITNVASAIIKNPEITERIVIVWLGGNDIHWRDTKEFNMDQDIAAARVVFNCGCPLVQLPCMGVVSSFYTTHAELKYWLEGKNALCDYLVKHTVEEAESYAKGRVWSRVIWDVCAAAWILNDNFRFMDAVVDHTPIPTYDGRYAFDNSRPLYLRVTNIKRDELFGELFRILAQ